MKLLECPVPAIRIEGEKCKYLRIINGRKICGRTPFPFDLQIPLWYENGSVLMWVETCVGLKEGN
jgi:hypothetical protein